MSDREVFLLAASSEESLYVRGTVYGVRVRVLGRCACGTCVPQVPDTTGWTGGRCGRRKKTGDGKFVGKRRAERGRATTKERERLVLPRAGRKSHWSVHPSISPLCPLSLSLSLPPAASN